jgi:hypothetical protein
LENELSGILRTTNDGLLENSTPPNMYCYAFLTAAELKAKVDSEMCKIREGAETISLLSYGCSKLSASDSPRSPTVLTARIPKKM